MKRKRLLFHFCSTLSVAGTAPGIIKCEEYKNQIQLGNKLMSALNCWGLSLAVQRRPQAAALCVCVCACKKHFPLFLFRG